MAKGSNVTIGKVEYIQTNDQGTLRRKTPKVRGKKARAADKKARRLARGE